MPKKKNVQPEQPPIRGMQTMDFSGMTREEQAITLGLSPDATLAEIRKAAMEELGLKGKRRSKYQQLTEAERAEKAEEKRRKAKQRREDRLEALDKLGIPRPQKREPLSEEERKARRSERGKKRRASNKEMMEWAKNQRRVYEQQGWDIPDWMKKLK